MRLHKFLADCGVASRRGAEALIAAGCVSVNGESVSRQGVQIDPDKDHVCVEGRRVSPPTRHVYFMLHKPRGYLTTAKDPRRRKTVLDLMKKVHERIFPVGRLDLASEGLLLLTTDGELANHLMHPRYHLEKEYHVKVDRIPTEDELARLSEGLKIGTERAKAS
ncbi:MAG: pseudouridine synthase, partial [bacterium]